MKQHLYSNLWREKKLLDQIFFHNYFTLSWIFWGSTLQPIEVLGSTAGTHSPPWPIYSKENVLKQPTSLESPHFQKTCWTFSFPPVSLHSQPQFFPTRCTLAIPYSVPTFHPHVPSTHLSILHLKIVIPLTKWRKANKFLHEDLHKNIPQPPNSCKKTSRLLLYHQHIPTGSLYIIPEIPSKTSPETRMHCPNSM